MKKIHLLLIGFLAFLTIGIPPQAQAQNAGDLAVVYFRFVPDGVNNVDSVSILTLTNLAAGTKIYLTAQSAHNNGGGAEDFDNTAGTTGAGMIYTVPVGGISAYSLITYDQGVDGGPGWAEYSGVHGAAILNAGQNLAGGPALELEINFATGNQLFLFRSGGGSEPAADPVFIYGLEATENSWLTSPVSAAAVTNALLSLNPPTLIAANASLDLPSPTVGFGVARGAYIGTKTFTSQAHALSQISNPANWSSFDFVSLFNTVNVVALDVASSNIHNPAAPFSGPSAGPTAVCQNLTLPLNTSGNTTIVDSDLEGGTTGGQTPYSYAASQTSFNCSNLGPNTVTLTVTDANSAASTCSATVTVNDNTPPQAVCQDVTVSLDTNGDASISGSELDGGSSDNCGIATYSASKTTFDCTDLGPNSIALDVIDASGNVAGCNGNVTVENINLPTAVCANYTTNILFGNSAFINASDVDGGSSSVCNSVTLSATPLTFTCNNLGNNTVTLTATDTGNGLTHTCFATVTVEDPNSYCCDAPVANCNAVTVELDGNGNGSLAASDAGAGSTADCGLASETVSPNAFVCNDVGAQSATYTITDINGASATCNVAVSVQDNIAPDAQCQPATVSLDFNGSGSLSTGQINNGSDDNCGIATYSASQSSFSCSDPNPSTVTLTVTDVNGNTADCTASVTLIDNGAPMANCQFATVQLDAQGNGSLGAGTVDNGSNDACGQVTLSVAPNTFDCTDLGSNTVTLTVTDQSGNTASCSVPVAVQDRVSPTITIVGDNPLEVCEFDPFTDPGATWSDNCAGSGSVVDVTSDVNPNQDGIYTIKYNYTDPSGNAAIEATRTVVVRPTPGALAQQGCGNCGEIRVTICQFDPAPDLQALVLSNPDYEAGATLNWYADNNGTKGSPLPGAPVVNPNQPGTDWYWVEQQLGDCPGPAIRVRVRVKKQFAPEFNLPAIGCGAGAGQVDLAAWVSDPKNKTTLYTFYSVDPVANPGATPIGSATATNGVVNYGQNVIVNVALGSQTYWVQNTVPNGCGSTASSTLVANVVNATLNFIPDITVNSGDPVNVTFSGTNATHIVWVDPVSFSNPNIGIVGSIGLNPLVFTAFNPTQAPLRAKVRVIAYNGNCAGQYQDFFITVNPGAPNRQGPVNSLQLAAKMINVHDVMVNWSMQSDVELIRFEIEKQRNDGEFESIGYQDWKGNGSYQYTDKSGMSNANQYRLKLIYADGRVVWSETVEVNIDFTENERFTLFPNPTSGQFMVKALFPVEAAYTWQLSDVMGKTLMKGTMKEQQTTIQIESLATGVYHLVMISPEGKRYLMKVVKQ